LLKLVIKKLSERALRAEMAEHLRRAKNDTAANAADKTRNGKSNRALKERPWRAADRN
jgi:transposase-like protein